MGPYPTLMEIEDGIRERPKDFKWSIDDIVDIDKDKNLVEPFVDNRTIELINYILEGCAGDYDLYKKICEKVNKKPLNYDNFDLLIKILKLCAVNNIYRHEYFILGGLGHFKGCTICMNQSKKYGECSSGG